jgi:hypothetical protein
MLFQLIKDDGPALHEREEVSFHCERDRPLLALAMASFGFAVMTFNWAEPKVVGRELALAASCFGIVALFFGGLSTAVVFRKTARRMDINWMIFGSALFSHSHPYAEVEVTLHSIVRVTGSRVVYDSGGTGTGYYARVGHVGYFLVYPEGMPADEAHLATVRKGLGFDPHFDP